MTGLQNTLIFLHISTITVGIQILNIRKPDKNVRFSNGIQKPDHSITEQLWTIRKPDTSGFRIPTVYSYTFQSFNQGKININTLVLGWETELSSSFSLPWSPAWTRGVALSRPTFSSGPQPRRRGWCWTTSRHQVHRSCWGQCKKETGVNWAYKRYLLSVVV